MKIWTRGSSPRSGSRNAWTWIKNVSGTSRLSNFWNFFCAFQMISCRDCWPWTKRGYITVTRIQSSNQWSGGIAAHPAPNITSAGNVLASIFLDQDGIHLIDYIPKSQIINSDYSWSLLVQLKDILKEKLRGKLNKWVLFLHENASSPGTCNPEETGLPGLAVSWSPTLFSGSGPVGLPPVPWTEETIERSPFFFRRGGHFCRGDLVGWTTF